MQLAQFAAHLVDAGVDERASLLEQNAALGTVELAYQLKEICQADWRVEPARSVRAAAALTLLSNKNSNPEIVALARWAASIAALIEGQMDHAVALLDEAEQPLASLGREYQVAEIQLAKSVGLAMLGRYEEAIECGLRAREVFLKHDDLLATGKIEHNLGNLYFRRDRYHEAETFQRRARERYALLNDQKQLASINNCLANTHAVLHKFKSAEELYQQAVEQAEASAVPVTQAEIESNIGMFALLQGRYDRALDYLERSRRRYASLGMPHQSAIAEQEIADAYVELNLAPEAHEIYQRVIPTFAELGMRAEQARALAINGRAAMMLGNFNEAQQLLLGARQLYIAEGNEVGEAMVALMQAQLDYKQGRFAEAAETVAEAIPQLALSGSSRKLLLARWLQGEAARAQGQTTQAKAILDDTLKQALQNEQPQIAEICYTSLGLLASMVGEGKTAERCFNQAIVLIEELRAPLPSEEFRAAFFSDKLVPYHELVRLCLNDQNSRTAEAFGYLERARSRALVDSLGGQSALQGEPRDAFEAELMKQIAELRQELNYLYNELESSALKRTGAGTLKPTRQEIQEREAKTLQLMRQLQHRSDKIFPQIKELDVAQFQQDLGADTALLEFTTIDDEIIAFIVTQENIEVVRELGTEATVSAEVSQLRFQIDALRHGSAAMRRHLPELTRRAQRHLQSIYDWLLRPLESLLTKRRLVVVPHRSLHYLPFQALHNGVGYLLDRFEISYAPSAQVLQQCLYREQPELKSALLVGVADEHIPGVHDEIRQLAHLFPKSVVLLDRDATVAALRRNSPSADIVHLACHGEFRPDNPLFSSLKLGDARLTVREAYDLNLSNALVTLSACETGVNAVAPGEELLGLARGFFAAGATSLVISLWTVDDDTTATLMVDFYRELLSGKPAAAALRSAQLRSQHINPHPFFWSPFVLVGRW